jgi:nucleotide-binding universal stress UspA family protein
MHTPNDGPIQRVLLAVDLTSRSELVIRAARRVVPDSGAQLQLMHVVRDLAEVLGVYDSEKTADALQQEIETRAREQLQALRDDLLGDRPHVEIVLRKGPIWGEIVAAAMAFQADLAFMGAHFSDATKDRRAVGDLAAKISKIAPCPIVVVPSEDG